MAYKSSKKETHYSKSEKPPRKSSTTDRPSRPASDKPYGSRDDSGKKPFRSRDEGSSSERPAYKKRDSGDAKPYGSRGGNDRPFNKEGGSGDRPFRPRRDDSSGERPQRSNNDRPYQKRDDNAGERPFRPRRDDAAKPYGKRDGGGDKPFRSSDEGGDRPQRKSFGDKPSYEGGKRPYTKREDGDRPQRPSNGDKPPFKKREETGDRWEGRSYGDKPSFQKRERTDDRPQGRNNSDRPYQKRDEGDRPQGRSYGDKPYQKRDEGDRPQGRSYGDKPYQKREDGDRPQRKSYGDKPAYEGGNRPYTKREEGTGGSNEQRPARKPFGEKKEFRKGKPGGDFHSESPTGRTRVTRASEGDERRERAAKSYNKRTKFDRDDIWQSDDEEGSGKWDEAAKDGPMTLNKYLAHAGVSSRRDAATMVKDGKVQVNGEVMKTPGYRVKDTDIITLDGKTMTPQRHHVYILMNKPKDFITTTEDEKGRRTVLDLVASAGIEKLYPVGRLDRNTTGVLLLTNDGDLAQKLSHPSYDTKKIYQVTLDKNVTKADFDKILEGVELEDGKADVDRISYLENKNEIGLEIHSGRNRIVRRIFEHLGYAVDKLDRVMYAGLTKKNVSRGKWRFLNEKEVTFLKHFKSR